MLDIKIINIDKIRNFAEVDAALRTLISTLEYTLPGSRDFGLSVELVDRIPEQMKNDFAAALDEKIEKYLPQIKIADIDIKFNSAVTGGVDLQIIVEANERYKGGGDADD